MHNEKSYNSDFLLFQPIFKKESQLEGGVNMDETLGKIAVEMDRLAEKQANKIGWNRDMRRFTEGCLYCTARCHLRGQPDVRHDFLEDLWQILPAYGINPLPIQEAFKQKLLEKPWTTTVAYRREDILKLVADQLINRAAKSK